MDFDEFLYAYPKMHKITLAKDYKGKEYQAAMSPKDRLDIDMSFIEDAKEAAVLVYIYPDKDDQTHIVLTLRAKYDGDHSSEISLPGGKKEAQDETLKDTAKRETREELGLGPHCIDYVVELTPLYIPTSNFMVATFMAFYIDDVPEFKNNKEVVEFIEIKTDDLIDDKYVSTEILTTSSGEEIEVPCFKFGKHIVWGATAMVLNEVKELFKLTSNLV